MSNIRSRSIQNRETLKEIVDENSEKSYRIIDLLKEHSGRLEICPEKQRGICLQDWKMIHKRDPNKEYDIHYYWCTGKGHVYHYDCAAEWEKKTCPLCTAEIKEPEDQLN